MAAASEAVVAIPERVSEEESALWRRWTESRDAAARSELIARYLWLARTAASQALRDRSFDADLDRSELVQMATVGLMESVDRYDPDRGVPFSAYAKKRIHGALVDGIDRSSEYRAQSSWARQMIRERSESLAAHGQSSQDSLQRLAEVAVGLAIGFMLEDSGMYSGSEERTGNRHYDVNELFVVQQQLRLAVAELPPTERRVLELHYFDELSFARIGELQGVSKVRIFQIHARALMSMRRHLKLLGTVDRRV